MAGKGSVSQRVYAGRRSKQCLAAGVKCILANNHLMRKLFRRLLRITCWSLPLLFLGTWFVVDHVLPYTPVKPYRHTGDSLEWLAKQGVRPEDFALHSRLLHIRTRDSLDLQALVVPIEKAPGQDSILSTLIVLHGITGCKEMFLPFAKELSAHGIQAVLPDLRAHGKSGGEYCTYGFYEKHDISALIDTLLSQNPRQRIGIYGNSLGGAVALQALAEDKRLKFGVIESTFHDLEAVSCEYGEDLTGIKSRWLAHHVLEKSAIIAHFDPFSVQPGESARLVTQPVFMAHGDCDDKIPFAFGRINFDHLASSDKNWYTVHGGGHLNIRAVGGVAYDSALWAFLARNCTSK